jgi:predicted ester cyclase
MSNAANAALAEPWKDLRNGDLSLTDKIIAEDFVAHAAPLTGTGSDQIRHFPGASPEAAGREITFTGTDTLRIADGRLAECWANADSLLFFRQLGIREIPARG